MIAAQQRRAVAARAEGLHRPQRAAARALLAVARQRQIARVARGRPDLAIHARVLHERGRPDLAIHARVLHERVRPGLAIHARVLHERVRPGLAIHARVVHERVRPGLAIHARVLLAAVMDAQLRPERAVPIRARGVTHGLTLASNVRVQ